jgi:LmbE family N-acetylglucosaminyl deacetylase
VNKVIILTKGSKSAKGNETPEDARQAHMEKVLKEWGVNKGIWLQEMRIK